MKTREAKLLNRIKEAGLEHLTGLHITDLVYDWYYESELHYDIGQMYLNGSVELDFYMTSKRHTQILEDYLFMILENDYKVENPYTNIPMDLDYVLNIVK